MQRGLPSDVNPSIPLEVSIEVAGLPDTLFRTHSWNSRDERRLRLLSFTRFFFAKKNTPTPAPTTAIAATATIRVMFEPFWFFPPVVIVPCYTYPVPLQVGHSMVPDPEHCGQVDVWEVSPVPSQYGQVMFCIPVTDMVTSCIIVD
jgi:hypothetical protein